MVERSVAYLERQLKKARDERKQFKRELAKEAAVCQAYYKLWRDAQDRLDKIEALNLESDMKRIADVGLYSFAKERGIRRWHG